MLGQISKKNSIGFIVALGSGVLFAQKRVSEAVLLCCIFVIYSMQTERQLLLTNKQGAAAAVVVPEDKAAPSTVNTTVVEHHVSKGSEDDAVKDSVEQSDEVLTEVPKVEPIPESSDLSGKSKFMFDNQFTLLKHQASKPLISATFEKTSEPIVSAQSLDEVQSKQSFYDTIASGGDVQTRIPPGLSTLEYLSK